MKTLTKQDVQFVIEVELDSLPLKGNVQVSEDPESDQETENYVQKQLDSGNVYAWCQVKVIAIYNNFEGIDILGAISVENKDELDVLIKDHGMYDVALDNLNSIIAKLS